MNKKLPLVSIIILNCNGKHHLDECFKSIKQTNYHPFEAILVDNASSDGSIPFIENNFPWVKIVRNHHNLGFAEGNNRGIEFSSGKYIILLNNDTKVHPDWITELVKIAESDRTIGACACKLLFYDKPSIINSVGMIVDNYGKSLCKGWGEKDVGQYEEVEEVFSAYGAAMFLCRDALEKSGVFDERYFILYEEVDLCWRIRLAGYKINYVPSAVVFHKVGSFIGEMKVENKYRMERNRLSTILKNFSTRSLLQILPHYIIHKFGDLFFAIRSRNFGYCMALLGVLRWNLVNLKSTMTRRLFIQKNMRKINDEEIKREMAMDSLEMKMFFSLIH